MGWLYLVGGIGLFVISLFAWSLCKMAAQR